ncbi:MAG TPA: carboxypeptidase-like regulatory domain-containing protein [Bryobacteraceae bacterium]|nr:carboxypeptidase-like regulatory domain-containing protein [Bryobacteraceae bacterium]
MRRLIALLYVLPLIPSAQTGDFATISGQVLNAVTGEPIRKAVLTLRSTDFRPNSTSPPPSFGTVTDAAGRFAMKDLDPGAYRLTAEHTGFVSMDYGARAPGRAGTAFSLGRAQSMADMVFRLSPQGVISGRVVDEDGDPVRNVTVQAARYRYTGAPGRRQLTPSGGSSTNDLGEFRLFDLAPGRYYLSAMYRPPRMQAAEDRSAVPRPDDDYVTTFYPGTKDAAAAVQLDVTPGAQLRGIDITLAKARTVRIRGRVVNDSPARTETFSVMLVSPASMGATQGGTTKPNGEFEILHVLPGSYFLTAHANQGMKSYSAKRTIEVGSGNIEDVTLTIGPGATVGGHVRVDGDTAQSLAGIQLQLTPFDGGSFTFGPLPNGKLNADGSFKLEDVNADRYAVNVTGLPDGFYVKSARAGNVDVLASGLDVTGAPTPVEILLSPNAGQIAGMVQNLDTQHPARAATVALIPQEKERRETGSFYKITSSNASGSFTFRSLVPGEYKVFAFEDVEPGAWFDPDFLKPLEDKGQAVTIRESGRESVQVTLIPAGGSPAER